MESSPGSGTYIEVDGTDGLVGSYTVGAPIRYRFVVTNTGNVDLDNVELTDDLTGLLCNATIGALAASDLRAGETVSLVLTARIDDATAFDNGDGTNRVSLVGDELDGDPDDNAASVSAVVGTTTTTTTTTARRRWGRASTS